MTLLAASGAWSRAAYDIARAIDGDKAGSSELAATGLRSSP
jgi:hypothetical protein